MFEFFKFPYTHKKINLGKFFLYSLTKEMLRENSKLFHAGDFLWALDEKRVVNILIYI